MKTVFLICFALLSAVIPAAAQCPAFEKDVLIVDFFSRSREVPMPYAELLRANVVEAFAARGRQNIVDAESVRAFAASVPGTGLTNKLSASADLGAFLSARAPEALASGARYLVCGAVVDYKFEHITIPGSNGHAPRPGFKASFCVLLAALDLKTGERLTDAQYDLTASAPIAEDADRAALARIGGSLSFYIDNRFKIESTILELCPPDKKGRIRELFIHSGSHMGVSDGDLFVVYEEVPVGGITTRMKIGKLRVNNAENTDVARCKITKGDEEIVRAFTAGRAMICISDGKTLFY